MRKSRLGREAGADLAGSATASERLDMTWDLAVEAWSLTDQALPDHERARAPVRRVAPRVGRRGR